MDVKKVTAYLKEKYPGKNIVQNGEPVSEILCEIEPSSLHPKWSEAIAVIDKSAPHKHFKTAEEYEVITGSIGLNVGGKEMVLGEGEKTVIKPGKAHFATGNETWVRVYSRPGWTSEDHLIINAKERREHGRGNYS